LAWYREFATPNNGLVAHGTLAAALPTASTTRGPAQKLHSKTQWTLSARLRFGYEDFHFIGHNRAGVDRSAQGLARKGMGRSLLKYRISFRTKRLLNSTTESRPFSSGLHV
jgi:hypothetical protein